MSGTKTGLAFFGGLLVVAAFAAGLAMLMEREANAPKSRFLPPHDGAVWINSPRDISFSRRPPETLVAWFRTSFASPHPDSAASLTVRALREAEVFCDGNPIPGAQADTSQWRQALTLSLPPLQPGTHELRVRVRHRNGLPALWVHGLNGDLATDPSWESSPDGVSWQGAWPVTRIPPPEVGQAYPSAAHALRGLVPLLLAVFFLVGGITLLYPRLVQRRPRLRLSARRVRNLSLLFLAALFFNNLARFPVLGFDLDGHLDYIRFLIEQQSLPLATDGWQMFQPPFYYVLAAPIFALFDTSEFTQVMGLRRLGFVCALAQVVLVAAIARQLFPIREDRQGVAIVIGGFLPMSLYMAHAPGNEPLFAVFSSLTLLFLLRMVVEDDQPTAGWSVGLGFAWGAALLTKVTALLLAPAIGLGLLAVSLRQIKRSQFPWAPLLTPMTAAIVSGWYFFRNKTALGVWFDPGWDPAADIAWWDPGYRTLADVTRFGASLARPVHAAVFGFWDAMYSSIWLDGYLSSAVEFSKRPPWNDDFLVAGAPLALIPTGLIVLGILFGYRALPSHHRGAVYWTLAAALGTVWAVVLLRYLQYPIYAAAKGSHTLGLLAVYAAFAAMGAGLLLRGSKSRAVVFAALAVWLTAVYGTYFIR